MSNKILIKWLSIKTEKTFISDFYCENIETAILKFRKTHKTDVILVCKIIKNQSL